VPSQAATVKEQHSAKANPGGRGYPSPTIKPAITATPVTVADDKGGLT
jgi:hypothetical protein